MVSVCVLSAAWGRPHITRLVLRQRQRLCEGLASGGIQARMLIVADDENLDVAREHGAETLEHPNSPLGKKCSAGLKAAAEIADYVCWVGSDDWIHPDVFKPLRQERSKPVIVTGRRLAIVDMAAGRLQRLESPSKYGAIPWLIDSRLLRSPRTPNLMQPDLQRGLDGGLIRGLRLARIDWQWVFDDPHDFRCVDFKTEANITPYAGLAKNLGVGAPENAWDALTGWFPADLIDDARKATAWTSG